MGTGGNPRVGGGVSVDKEFKSVSSAQPASLEQVERSVHSDLQYVSIQVDGKTYGGWYRLLPDGQMELLALANMHCERRHENTAVEQARGMLTDFIRVARPKDADQERRDFPLRTLGDLLYADQGKARVPEQDWVGLVQSIASGDQPALRALYERSHRIVFTLLLRLTHDRQTAEDLTLEVFHTVWRRAASYGTAGGSVVGWIMNQARTKAIDHLAFEPGKKSQAMNGSAEVFALAGSTDVPCPSTAVWERLAQRIEADGERKCHVTRQAPEPEPAWEEVAPGISCKLLSTDTDKSRVSMLVRLAPAAEYPPHTHAGEEELHLLEGELWIDQRKLRAGDYHRAEPHSADKRVWTETGCMCVLMTSTRDVIG